MCVSFTYAPLKDTAFVFENWHPIRSLHKRFLLAPRATRWTASTLPRHSVPGPVRGYAITQGDPRSRRGSC